MSWAIGLVALALAVLGALKMDRRVALVLVRASKGSAVRALGVLVAYSVALVLAGSIATLVTVQVRENLGVLPGALLTGVFVAIIGPFTVTLMPQMVTGSSQSATASRELRRQAKATPAVSRVLGIGGALLWFVTVTPFLVLAMLGLGILRE